MSDYVIRIARVGDAEAVEALLKSSYPALMAHAYEARTLGPALERITRANASLLSSGRYFVAESRNTMTIGCGGWAMHAPGTGSRVVEGLGHLRHFATHPDWVRRGVARAIYGQCLAAFRQHAIERLEVLSSLNAEGFYAALGFERVREVDTDLGSGIVFPAILMTRRLP